MCPQHSLETMRPQHSLEILFLLPMCLHNHNAINCFLSFHLPSPSLPTIPSFFRQNILFKNGFSYFPPEEVALENK